MVKLNKLPEVAMAYSTFTSKTPHAYLDINREKAELMDVSIGNIYSTLQTYLGSLYVNDVNIGTQANKVMVMADWKYRKIWKALRIFMFRAIRETWFRWEVLLKSGV